MTASTTRMQTISGGEGDSVAWPPDLRFDIKNPPSVSRGGLTITRDPFRCRSGRISLAGNHLAQVWQVGEGVSPALDAFSIWGRAYRSQGRAQLSLAVSMTS